MLITNYYLIAYQQLLLFISFYLQLLLPIEHPPFYFHQQKLLLDISILFREILWPQYLIPAYNLVLQDFEIWPYQCHHHRKLTFRSLYNWDPKEPSLFSLKHFVRVVPLGTPFACDQLVEHRRDLCELSCLICKQLTLLCHVLPDRSGLHR